MTEQEQTFRDPYEVRIGIPTASWKYARVGDGFRGILLPQKDRAYLLSQQHNIQGEPLWWNTPSGGKEPRVQQDMLFGFVTNLKTGKPIGDDEFISNKAVERFANAKTSGDPDALDLIERVNKFGLRRQIIKGESLEKGMKAAIALLAATLGPKPILAAYVSFKLIKLEPNEHQGETKIFEIKYEAPDDASRAGVAEYRATLPQDGDPYAGRAAQTEASTRSEPAGGDDEEPPF
jgi:hypothetical protein